MINPYRAGAVFSYKLRYIVGFWLVEMAISTNQKPTIYRNLYENTGPEICLYKPRDETGLFQFKSSLDKVNSRWQGTKV